MIHAENEGSDTLLPASSMLGLRPSNTSTSYCREYGKNGSAGEFLQQNCCGSGAWATTSNLVHTTQIDRCTPTPAATEPHAAPALRNGFKVVSETRPSTRSVGHSTSPGTVSEIAWDVLARGVPISSTAWP